MTVTLPHNFTPRPYQLKFLKALDSGIKRVVLTWARRSGKDVCALNWCIKKLMQETATCFYIMPTYSQGKKVIWDSVNNDGFRFLDYFPKEIVANQNNQEMKIRLINGSLFQVIGSDNIDSLMGTNPKIVVFSEYALQDPAAWDFIRPILKVNGGVAIFISTPRGRNHFYDIFRTAQVTEGWFAELLTINDTGVLTSADVEQEKKEGMSEELALQEYYCSFDRGIEGSYYANILLSMRNDERIGIVKHDPSKLVHTSCDLGWDDDNPIIFFQVVGTNIHIIDCENYRNKTLAHMKDVLNSRPYKYGTHLFPHDVEQNDGLGSGCTRRDILNDLAIPVTVVPKGLIADGIEAVKALMSSRMYIDEKKCAPLIKALEHYHREWNDKHKVYNQKPFHDASSHFADAMRYLAVGLPKCQGSTSLEDDVKALNSYWR
jgi:hypothetical protein